MAWLRFSRSKRQIQLFGGSTVGALVSALWGTWSAHNDVAATSDGPWPVGTYSWSHYKDHVDQPGFGPGCFATAYGCFGIHVFSVPGRMGMGVHAGRTKYTTPKGVTGGKTMGCIRVPENAMTMINSVHNTDPIVGIVVEP